MKMEVVRPPLEESTEACAFMPIDHFSPRFPGGSDSLSRFMNTNFRCEEICDSLLDGVRVVVQFGVDTFGVTQNVEILETANTMVDQELIRVVSLLKNWIPATYNGRKVYDVLHLPVCFELSE
jgi:periplasmic protein TonB